MISFFQRLERVSKNQFWQLLPFILKDTIEQFNQIFFNRCYLHFLNYVECNQQLLYRKIILKKYQ
jgi:hypothetical protein